MYINHKTKKMAKEKIELSEEEMAAKREELTAFYKENIVHLKSQLEYEECLRDIEKARAERVQAQMFLAQAMAAGTEESNATPDEVPVKRTLKKVSDEV